MTKSQTSKIAPLITYEGIEGAGKSTQLKRVASYFSSQAYDVLVTREPGGTSIAEKIRSILIHPEKEILSAKTELYLMQAARVQHLQEVLIPALETKDIILCDRFIDSSTAYQGAGRKIGMQVVQEMNMFSTGGKKPDLTFLIDIPIELSLSRIAGRNAQNQAPKQDRFESEKYEFYSTIRQAFLDIAKAEPSRIIVLDGTLKIEALIDMQIGHIESLLSK